MKSIICFHRNLVPGVGRGVCRQCGDTDRGAIFSVFLHLIPVFLTPTPIIKGLVDGTVRSTL